MRNLYFVSVVLREGEMQIGECYFPSAETIEMAIYKVKSYHKQFRKELISIKCIMYFDLEDYKNNFLQHIRFKSGFDGVLLNIQTQNSQTKKVNHIHTENANLVKQLNKYGYEKLQLKNIMLEIMNI